MSMKITNDPGSRAITIENGNDFLDAVETWQGNLRVSVGDGLGGRATIKLGKREALALSKYLEAYAEGK